MKIQCVICGCPIPAKLMTITCSEKCRVKWERKVFRLYAENRQAEREQKFCPFRYIIQGGTRRYGVNCVSADDPEYCEECGWNPDEERRRKERRKK